MVVRSPRQAGLAAALVWLGSAFASAQERDRPFELEGPLNNDAFTPRSERAEEELARGDRSWKRALEDPVAGTRERGLAFEAWRTALEVSETGDAVAMESPDVEVRELWPDPTGSHGRRSEGVAFAVLRRLNALEERSAAEWIARFDPVGEVALTRAGAEPGSLARIERDLPWTRAAAIAALKLCDQHLERGETLDAAVWLTRSERHVRGRDAIRAALDSRRAVLAQWNAAARRLESHTTGSTQAPEALELVRSERLERIPSKGLRQRLKGGLEPGLAFTDTGSVIIQSPIGIVQYRDDARSAGPRLLRTRFNDLLGKDWNTPYVTSVEGGWPLFPVVSGRHVVVVVGRSVPLTRAVSFSDDRNEPSPTNILACLRLDESDLPEIVWTLSGKGLLNAEGQTIASELFDGPAWEVQPGPLVHAGRVFAMVRVARGENEGENELWLHSFDLATGAPLWSRFLTKASGLPGEATSRSRRPASPAQPLSLIGDRVFAGTNAGLGVLFESVDGRLVWSFKNRRRTSNERGWPGARRPLELATDQGRLLVWGPYDSDQLYTLAAEPDLAGLGIMRRADIAPIAAGAPYARGQGHAVGALGANELLVLGFSGSRAALSAWDARGGRIPSIYLGREETFSGSAWASEDRLIAASDRYLYLFDRANDLRLIDARALEDEGGGRGGSVYVSGNRVFVLGPDTLWHFRSR